VIDPASVRSVFAAEVWSWRGPSPYHFVTVPEADCAALRAVAAEVSYGWGMIPVNVRLGRSSWTTSLFPKDGRYVVPLRDSIRAAEGIAAGDIVELELAIRT
jgi:hypothetical protein